MSPGAPAQGPRVVAVVVAYRRPELLAEALAALAAQIRPPEVVVVVDNASGDGSPEVARTVLPAADVLVLERNTGGAGGFAVGIAAAVGRHRADLVWVMDDDTVPEPGALAALLAVWCAHPGRPAVVASRVVWHDGRDHPMNTPRTRPGATRAERGHAAAVGCVPVRSASFVSCLLEAGAVRSLGLPVADYFLWNDDFEYSTRLLRDRAGLFCPASVVVHKTRTFGGTDADPGERFYFEVRNKVWMLSRADGLRPGEKLLYGASTLRRWARTLQRSQRRRVLLDGLARGLADALRRGPRPNTEVLAGLAAGVELPGPGAR